MTMHPPFPPHRRKNPRRGANFDVYDQLADSGLSDHPLDERRPLSEAPKLDFVVWIEGVGRCRIEVKGGKYSVDGAV